MWYRFSSEPLVLKSTGRIHPSGTRKWVPITRLAHTSSQLGHDPRTDRCLNVSMIIAPQETRTQLSALSVQKKGCDRYAIQPILGLLYSERSLQSFQLAGEYPFPFDTVNFQITILVDWTHLPLRLHEQNFRIIEKR